MIEQNQDLTESELKKKAYLLGRRLKNEGFDSEIIYARLEKQGIPENLARKVISDIFLERKKEAKKQEEQKAEYALVKAGIGVLAAILCSILFPDAHWIPIGLIAGGVISAVWSYLKMDN